MDPIGKFEKEKEENIKAQGNNAKLKNQSLEFILESAKNKYSYNFSWMGRPIIALPQDMLAMQEIIWNIKPDLIIETGIAHGGSLVYYASLLELIGEGGLIVGIDIDIRKYNKELIEEHPMFKRIRMIEGDSTSESVANQVYQIAKLKKTVL